MKLKVCAYCRVSTDNSDQQNSYESQKSYYEEYIKSNPEWEFVGIYADEGISGTSIEKREDFKRMISDAYDNKFNLILTKEIARFARNTVDSLDYTRKLRKIGVGVFFTLDNINTLDKDGELRLSIMSALAQDESRRTSERVKWGQKRRMEQGIVFGRSLLGYNVKDGALSINENESETVKLIFHKYLNEGKGTHVIGRELYELGIKPKHKAKYWSNIMIFKVLKNEKYVGDLLQKKTYTPDFLDHKKKYNKGQEEMVYLKNHHEPIIDRDTWDATQIELNKRTTTKEQKSKYSNRYWCSGKLKCAVCGNRFVSRNKKLGNGQPHKSWRCMEYAFHGKHKVDSQGNSIGCDSGSINHVALEGSINYILKFINFNSEQFIAELSLEIKKLSKQQKIKNTDSLYNKIDGLNKKKEKILDSMIEGFVSKEDMKMMNNKYDLEIEEIKKEIQDIENINLINSKQVEDIQFYINEIKSIMNYMNSEDMINTYKEIVEKIVVYNDNILEIYLTLFPYPLKIIYEIKGRRYYSIDYKVIS